MLVLLCSPAVAVPVLILTAAVNLSIGPTSSIPDLRILAAAGNPTPSAHGLTCSVIVQVSQRLGSQDIRDPKVLEKMRLGMSFSQDDSTKRLTYLFYLLQK